MHTTSDTKLTEQDSSIRYTLTAIPEVIKKELVKIKLELNKYLNEIKVQKKYRLATQYYYDYDQELDFSIPIHEWDPKKNDEFKRLPKNIKRKILDDRLYYYKGYFYLKLGLFKKKDVPPFKVKLSHMSQSIIYELLQLDKKDRNFVLKQAVGRILEDINFDIYHYSVASNLKVILVK
jgi:hypothetical protein